MTNRRRMLVDATELERQMRGVLEPALEVDKDSCLRLFRLLLWHLGEWTPHVTLSDRQLDAVLGSGYGVIAAIVMNTYLGRGEEADLADDEALEMIGEVLLSIDARLLDLARDRNLARRPHRRTRRRRPTHE